MLVALNSYLKFAGRADCCVRTFRMQKQIFREADRELSCEEYRRLVEAVGRSGNERLCHILQTIGATGIRISELPFITVEVLRRGTVSVQCKGKARVIVLPRSLILLLEKYCRDKKTVVFLPLVKTSQKFRDILNAHGFQAAEVNGESQDRAEILQEFDAGRYNVLCNSMLLTEGWDCPSVDCIVVLRPTKVRSLYCQMVGRGTRLAEGKDHLLLLDFLWHTERHELCHPASLICESEEVARKMTENLEKDAGCLMDLEEAEQQAASDVVAQREEALAKKLAEMKRRKRKLVDPLQFEMSIQAEDLAGYVPAFGWEMAPPSESQKKALEKQGIMPDEIDNAGKASKLLDRLSKRRQENLTTPKQIRFLEGKGFQHVGTWSFDSARKLIDRIAGNGWRVPHTIDPYHYVPGQES